MFVSLRKEDDMGAPTDEVSHKHFHCTHGHCNSHMVTLCVCASRPNLYHKTTAASTVLDARGAPVLGVGGAQEEQDRALQVWLSSSPNTHCVNVPTYLSSHIAVIRCAWCT